MKQIIISLLLLSMALFAQDDTTEVDCLILEDENSIICKYIHERLDVDKNITFEWIDPDGNISRSRDMIVPANHASVYDFRYMDGRKKGMWTFKVIDGKKTFETNFEVK